MKSGPITTAALSLIITSLVCLRSAWVSVLVVRQQCYVGTVDLNFKTV